MTLEGTEHGRAFRYEQRSAFDARIAGQTSDVNVHITGQTSDLNVNVTSGVEDTLTGAQAAIDWAHHEIHEGDTFLVSYKSPDNANVADNGTINMHVVVGAKNAHMIAHGACGGDMEGELYEGTTINGATGTTMTAYNKNRASANTSGEVVKRDITVNALGTLLENEFVPGGTGGNTVGGAGTQRAEWILKAATAYMLRITNRAGTAQPMSLTLEWYEEG